MNLNEISMIIYFNFIPVALIALGSWVLLEFVKYEHRRLNKSRLLYRNRLLYNYRCSNKYKYLNKYEYLNKYRYLNKKTNIPKSYK